MSRLPREEIAKAAKLLLERGATEVYLFGSQREGQTGSHWDVDLAIRRLPKGTFFAVLGETIMLLNRPVDLVDLDFETPFVHHLLASGELERVA